MSTIQRDLQIHIVGNICGECGGRNGHTSPFCRKLNLQESLADEEVCNDIDAVLEKRKAIRLREILFEVIDDGDEDGPWMFYHPFEPVADEQRTRFIEAVVTKLKK